MTLMAYITDTHGCCHQAEATEPHLPGKHHKILPPLCNSCSQYRKIDSTVFSYLLFYFLSACVVLSLMPKMC